VKGCPFCNIGIDEQQEVDLTEEEWSATYSLLKDVKILLDERYSPEGF
jgi:hypothetical protein